MRYRSLSYWFFTFYLLLLPPGQLMCQSLSGLWQGTLEVGDGTEIFDITLELEDQKTILTGQMRSIGQDTTMKAFFQVSGWYNTGDSLYLQDIQQLEPPSPAWCVKRMAFEVNASIDTLTGIWTAPGCTGGQIRLARVFTQVEKIKEEPFSPVGAWTGQLQQSDRSYGFYFTLQLEADGSGISYIVSEGGGGEAQHQLTWTFDPATELLSFWENKVIQRTVPDWKWCIKKATLRKEKGKQKYVLAGDWSGKIEGVTGPLSACAPGKMILEKPVLRVKVQEKIASIAALPVLKKRPVRVAKTIDVEGEQVKLFLWDNGLVDGDVISVYLNGQLLLDQYKVKKGKASLNIKLQKGPNFLVLVSDDMGSTPPSTIAVSIHDGVEEHQIILRSNQYESGAVLVRRIDF